MTPNSTPAAAAAVSRVRRMSGLLGYLVFVLVAVIGVNQWQSAAEHDRDSKRGKFIARVCVALDDFRQKTNDRNAPLYTLVAQAMKDLPDTDKNTGRPLTEAEKKERLAALQAFQEAYKPIPPVTNCDDPL